jgi:hypothetical protein
VKQHRITAPSDWPFSREDRIAPSVHNHSLTFGGYPAPIMAARDLVKRSQAAGRRAVGQAPVEDQVRWHRAQLAEDFGLNDPSRNKVWHDPLEGVAATVRRLVITTLLIALAIIGTAGAMMWRNGDLKGWLRQSPAKASASARKWELPEKLLDSATNKAAAIIDDSPPWPDPYEYLAPSPAPPKQADPSDETPSGEDDPEPAG